MLSFITFANAMKNRKIRTEKIGNGLLKILKHSIHTVPFYHNKFKKLSIKRINASWEKIPLLDRDILEKEWKNFISLSYSPNLLRFRLTTGTTRNKLKVFFNPLCYAYMNAVCLRNLLDSGYKLSGKIIHYDDYRPDGYFFQNFGIFKRIWISSKVNEEKQLEMLIKYKNSFLFYFPNSFFFISLLARKYKTQLKFRKIFFQAEKLILPVRLFFENFFRTELIDFYGCMETGMIAYEIEKNVYKINNDLLFVEVLDNDNNNVGAGERGRVVITNFLNRAFPLIRYEVGDFATVIEKKDGIITKISDINRYSLEDILKKKKVNKLVERAIKQNLEKFVLLYQRKKDKLEIGLDKNLFKKKRGKYEFMKTI